MIAESIHNVILAVLKNRFGAVARDVVKHLRGILDEEKRTTLTVRASDCPDLEAFCEKLFQR